MEGIRSGERSVLGAAEGLGVSVRRVQQLYGEYLSAGDGRDEWVPGRSGGDRRSHWTEEMAAFARQVLLLRPPWSYSFTASELRRRQGVKIHGTAVRRWALLNGLQHQEIPHRSRRGLLRWQCARIGELWQLDASAHRWLPEPAEPNPMLNMLDDSSRVIVGSRFYERELLLSYFDFLPRSFEAYGLPLELYVDWHSFFFTAAPDSLTQMGEALKFYEISFRYAPTAEAKGKIERSHLFWQNRLPGYFTLENVRELSVANRHLDDLRIHHNEHEPHRELACTPAEAWQTALREKRSVLRPKPACPWWPYIWSVRTSVLVGDDGRVPIGTQRIPIAVPRRTRVVHCRHPNGDVTILARHPACETRPLLLLHVRKAFMD